MPELVKSEECLVNIVILAFWLFSISCGMIRNKSECIYTTPSIFPHFEKLVIVSVDLGGLWSMASVRGRVETNTS